MLTNNCEKVAKLLYCETCHYTTSRKSSLDKHNLTTKHKMLSNVNMALTENCIKESECCIFSCSNCNKQYKSRVGLWKHKQKCKLVISHTEEQFIQSNEPSDKELIMMLIKENAEVKQLMLKVLENGTTNNSHNTTHTNSHNKAFNLNFFLNETCKNAMNIMDFVDSIKLQLTDLERVGELGFVEGISNIIVKNLNDLDVTERPIHCTDKKREVLYVKDENKWEKDEEKNKIRKVVKKVANKNIGLLHHFKDAHPDCGKSESVFSDQYNKIIIEAMGGSGDNDLEKEEKIIQKISKTVTIDRI